ERVRPSEAEVEAAREKKRERLYRGLQKWTQVRDDSIAACEADHTRLPDYKAGEFVLKNEALLANLEGTDVPTRKEVTGKDGAPLVGAPSPVEAWTPGAEIPLSHEHGGLPPLERDAKLAVGLAPAPVEVDHEDDVRRVQVAIVVGGSSAQ